MPSFGLAMVFASRGESYPGIVFTWTQTTGNKFLCSPAVIAKLDMPRPVLGQKGLSQKKQMVLKLLAMATYLLYVTSHSSSDLPHSKHETHRNNGVCFLSSGGVPWPCMTYQYGCQECLEGDLRGKKKHHLEWVRHSTISMAICTSILHSHRADRHRYTEHLLDTSWQEHSREGAPEQAIVPATGRLTVKQTASDWEIMMNSDCTILTTLSLAIKYKTNTGFAISWGLKFLGCGQWSVCFQPTSGWRLHPTLPWLFKWPHRGFTQGAYIAAPWHFFHPVQHVIGCCRESTPARHASAPPILAPAFMKLIQTGWEGRKHVADLHH